MSKARDRLIAAELCAALPNEIVIVDETESTNDFVWNAFEACAPEGLVVFAEHQTKGRGQYGRRWDSASSLGLWFSILLRPALSLLDSPRLTAILADALTTAIAQETGLGPTVKLPNDIYVSGRKVAGVLVEGRTASDRSYVAVAGIGINVNHAIEDFPEELRGTAGSLAMATGKKLSREKLAIRALLNINERVRMPIPDLR